MAKRIVYIIFLLFFSVNVYCQTPDWQWVEAIKANDKQIVKDIVSDPSNGDFYVVGKWKGNLSSIFTGTGFSTNFTNTRGNYDGFVAKYNSDNTLDWAFKVGGDSEDEINAISIDSDGNIYIAGFIGEGTSYFVGTGENGVDKQFDNPTSTNAFIVKYNSDGEFVWLQSSMGLTDAKGMVVHAGTDGIYFAGTTKGETSFSGESSAFGKGDEDIFIVKYDELGTKQWLLDWGSDEIDIPTAIYEKDSKLFIAGNFKGEYFYIYDKYKDFKSYLTNENDGSLDIFLASFNTNGTYGFYDWSESISSEEDDLVTGMVVDDANIYLTGGINSEASFPGHYTNGSTKKMDPFVSSIQISGGTTNWVKTFDCTNDGDQLAQGISFDALENLIIVGTFKKTLTFEETVPVSSGSETWSDHEAIFVASFDTSSNYVWSTLGGSGDNVSAVAVDANSTGNIYVAGTMDDDLIFNDITYTHVGSTDSYIGLLNVNCGVVAGSISASDPTICLGNSSLITLTGSTGVIAWESSISGDNVWTVISGETSSTLSVSPLVDMDYRASVSTDICTLKSDKLEIIVSLQPTTAIVGSDQDQCGTLISSSLNGNEATVGEGTWTQFSGPGTTTFSAVNSGSSTATASAYGTYVYRWTIANGTCASTNAELTVNYYETPTTAIVGSDQNQCGTLISSSLGGNTAAVGEGTWT
ncbi:hypothetical protein, partial [Ancylomarina sp. 16SWW S1-10-2]|uniref:hypothetical protein n=1 Tax=Ancylomarina sp. 16SWW S1-10-2 TaxID=2499681 RepID=UPI0012AD7886